MVLEMLLRKVLLRPLEYQITMVILQTGCLNITKRLVSSNNLHILTELVK
jgi:hypothetical protein